MKVCECGNEMIFSKFGYQYIWECEDCQATEMVNDDDLEEGDF